jgi:hypothetical protein
MDLSEDEARKIAHAIAFGHAYAGHAADLSESGELMTESGFEALILETLLNPAKSRELHTGRAAFWNEIEGLMVIVNPQDPEMGTAYWPKRGIDGYKRVR